MDIVSVSIRSGRNIALLRKVGLPLLSLAYTGVVLAQPVTPPGAAALSIAEKIGQPAFSSRTPLPPASSVSRPQTRANTELAPPMSYSLYTPELNLMAQTAPSTGANPPIAHEYIWFGGEPVAQIDVATNTVRTNFTDHLGTPVLQTDATGAAIWRAEYDPFGNVHQMRVGSGGDQTLRLRGQEAGTIEPGQESYNIFRWYRAGWGRYTQPDPIGLMGGRNLYVYSSENPISNVDPRGLRTCVIFTKELIPHTAVVVFGKCKNNGTDCSRPDRFLYDPAGGYKARQRGSGGLFEDDDFSMADYIKYQ